MPETEKGVPEPLRLIARFVPPLPPLKVALAVMERVVSTVAVGVPALAPKVVVKVVAASPIVKVPNTNVPAVPAQEAPLEPMQFAPPPLLLMVVVPLELKVWLEATLIDPELATEVEPTVKALLPISKEPEVTVSSLVASTATPAVNVPVPLMVRL